MNNIGVSALKTGMSRLDITSNNIANSLTNNYKEKTPIISEQKNGGVKMDDIRDTSEFDLSSQTSNDVDLEKQMVDLIQEKSYIALNAKALKTQNDTLGTLIDTFA